MDLILFIMIMGHVLFVTKTAMSTIVLSKNVWSWVDLLIFSTLPFMCLVVSNGLLVKIMTTSILEANLKLSVGQSDQANTRSKKVSSVTLTLVVVSTTFILLCLPLSVHIILDTFNVISTSDNDLESKTPNRFIYAFVSILWYCNSAVNFYLYCLTGSKFRTECIRVITCGMFPRRKEDSIVMSRSAKLTDCLQQARMTSLIQTTIVDVLIYFAELWVAHMKGLEIQ